ncbi:hypothetical protein RHSIM_Rhsim03G0016400 [Rhododendron simsii]|uniref:Uncharacterized protein n=1 Tax=Rhododendron simsii TaxID=118357 RepID=A0A834H7Z3_RHOSS|nr:hypothetical protein RHSIM_Rhsim03G0016400 [Rhododendron simsii]
MEQEQAIWTSPESNSMISATIGRAMSTLLSARPKKLEDAVSRLDSAPQRSSVASLEESLWILHSYVIDAAKREEPLDGVLVPMIEHVSFWTSTCHSILQLVKHDEGHICYETYAMTVRK